MNDSVVGGSVVWTFDVDESKFVAGNKKVNDEIDKTEKKIKDADKTGSSSFKNLGSSVGALADDFVSLGRKVDDITFKALAVSATAVIGSIVALGVKGVNSAKELQSLQISMNGLTHSMELGAEAMATAYKYAQKAPFQLPDVAATSKTLLAYGRNVSDLASDLETLGNVSITTGVPLQSLGGIFGQVSAQGKLMLGDIRQLTQNGVAILPALQKEFHKTAEQVQEMATDGQISFDQFRTAMQSLVDPKILEQLENTLPRQLDRLGGSVRILSNAFVGVGVDATNGFKATSNGIYQATVDITRVVANELRSPAVTAAAGAMGTTIGLALQEIPKFITENQGKIDNFFNGIARFFDNINKVAKEKGIGEAFKQVGVGIKTAIESIDFGNIGSKILNSIFASIGTIDYKKYSKNITNAILGIFTAIDYAALAAGVVALIVTAVPQIVEGLITGIIDEATKHPLDLLNFFLTIGFLPAKWVKALGEVLSKLPFIGPVVDFFLNAIKGVADFVLKPVKDFAGKVGGGIVDGVKDGASGLLGKLQDIFNVIINFFKDSGTWLLEKGKALISGLTDGIKQMGGALWSGISEVAANVGRFFSGAGSWLFDTGKTLIQGFINGISSMFTTVKNKLGELTSKLTSWKGPESLDKKILVGNGQLVIQGFITGLESQYANVKSSLNGLTNDITGDQTMNIQARHDALPSIGDSQTTGQGLGVTNNIDTINIGSEVDGENWLKKLTRDEEITSAGLTSNAI